MSVTLLQEHVETLLEAVSYSKFRVESAPDTPPEVRRKKLSRLQAAEAQLRAIREEINAKKA